MKRFALHPSNPDRPESPGRPDRYRAKRPLPNLPTLPRPPRRPAPRLLPVGDTGISVQFGTTIDLEANDAVAALDQAIAVSALAGIVETVPSFRALLVVYEPAAIERTVLLQGLAALCRRAGRARTVAGRRWAIPVAYAPPFGEDLAEAANLLGLSESAVVAAHGRVPLRVFMLGFQPGLPNLGGLPPELHLSRRTVPRLPVPGGSVMIGGGQGAIMPMPTPSGFYLLGRTPVCLFDRRRPEPALLRAGDTIRFRRIAPDDFAAIDARIAAGDLEAGAELEPAAPA